MGNGAKPDQVRAFSCSLEGKEPLTALDMQLAWEDNGAVGYNILWGYDPDKLYHSYMVYGRAGQKIGALVQKSPVYVRIDAFNENGITEGIVRRVR